ncbi:hypothetical protein C2869_05385 [Saccharobesus litoralis]|uniref:Uncharacterized protein n=1 Tax=Saccharobesus litoralis TaxID=2172099 RepID=A0A2S0VNX5_9ALTE|nr:hypothetical protein [Saccharobesus litoralis]AWB65909.1 hypothetical protein C2869_05385 [Saccharobesus litoralis]
MRFNTIFNRLKRVPSLFILSVATILLAACGSSDDDKTTSMQTVTIKGEAIKGTLSNASVSAYAASDMSTALATTSTGDNGSYELQFEKDATVDSGLIVVKVSADSDTEMTCDADKCGSVNNGDKVPASELNGIELLTSIAIDKGADVTIENLPVNALTTAATEIITQTQNAAALGMVNQSVLSDLQQKAAQVVMSAFGVDSSGSSFDLFTDSLPDATAIDAGVASLSANKKALATQLSLVNASFAGTDDGLKNELTSFANSIADAAKQGNFSTDLKGMVADLTSAYNELFGMLNASGGIPTGVTLPSFDSIEWPTNIDFSDLNIDNPIDQGAGEWTLTVSGTATVTHPVEVTTDIPAVTINNVTPPSSSDTTEIENLFKQQTEVQGITVTNVSFSVTEETSTKVVIKYSADISVTVAGQTSSQKQNIIYTYTR